MKKIFLTAAFVFCVSNVVSAQELRSVNYTTNQINESKLTLSENWQAYIQNNSVMIYNGNIKNESSDNAKNLNIELYLIPTDSKTIVGTIQGYHLTKVPFKSVAKNSSLVGVNIKSDVTQIPPSGLYDPILVLSNKDGKVLNFQKVGNTIESKEGNLAVYNVPVKAEGAVENAPELNPVVKIDVKEDNSIGLEKEWKVEVDFKNFMVKVIGGDIANRTDKDLNNMVLDVFLTSENQSVIDSNFEGVRIASAELDKIEGFKKFVDTTITTNLTTIPQTGTYNILLTLSVKDEKGNPVVRTKRAFANTISF